MNPFRMVRPRTSRLVAVVTAAALAVSVAACGDSDGSSSSGGEDVKIGLVTKTETNPFFVKMREAAKAQADKEGAELIALAGKFDGDNEGQVAAIENLVSQGVKGILITPNNSTGILGAIKKARDRDVVVIALDTETDPEDAVDATFATDNKEAGRLQGAWVKASIGSTQPKIAMLDGTAGGTVDTFRHDGFLDGFGVKENDPAVVGKENTNGDQAKAQTAMENLLQRNGDINVVYTINEPAARGAYEAIKSKGAEKNITIGSIDGSCSGVEDVKAGKVGATVMQFPKKMAEEGVSAVVEFAKNDKKPSGFNNTGAQLITDKPMQGLDSKDTAWGAQNCWG
jgi:fructose transport system substrate-binding protein